MQLLDGLKISQAIKTEIALEVDKLKAQNKRVPHLAAVLVGNNIASATYVNNKIKSCKEVGFQSSLIQLSETVTEHELISEIHLLNNNDTIDGFIVQLPLPKHIDEKDVINQILPSKDVDGFHPVNVGKMVLDLPGFLPATPKGILELLQRYQIETDGKHVVVVGRSNIVGMPVNIMLSKKAYPGNATVTLCHSATTDLKSYTLQADIIIAATGKINLITADMVKDGVVIIDVGMNKMEDASKKSGYRLVGDVDFENVSKKAAYITPVPGGVGLMTVASLLQNTLEAYKGTYYNKSIGL